MKKLLAFAAVGEATLAVIVLVYPPIVIRLLFGAEIAGPCVWISRLVGIALIGLAVACWPDGNPVRAFYGMATYSTLAMLYLAYVGLNDGTGILLWPAVAIHAGLSVLLVRAWWKERKTPVGGH